MKGMSMYVVIGILVVVVVLGMIHIMTKDKNEAAEPPMKDSPVPNSARAPAEEENPMLKQLKALKDARELDKAIELGQKLLKETPDDAKVLMTLGETYLFKGNVTEGEKLLLKSISVNPADGYTKRILADSYLSRKNTEKAAQYYQDVIEKGDPMNVIWAYTGLSIVNKITGKKDKSDQMLKKAMELAKDENAKKEINRRVSEGFK